MRVVILHSDVRSCASADERDVLTQVEAVSGALKELGHEALPMPFCLDLEAAAQRLRETACDLVFNLVETVGGQGRLIHLAPALLDFLKRNVQ
jgi:D-alanine-D-alanine ligase